MNEEKKRKAADAVKDALIVLNEKIRYANLVGLTVLITSDSFAMTTNKPPLQSEIYEQVRY